MKEIELLEATLISCGISRACKGLYIIHSDNLDKWLDIWREEGNYYQINILQQDNND
jgi:hypothetical protein